MIRKEFLFIFFLVVTCMPLFSSDKKNKVFPIHSIEPVIQNKKINEYDFARLDPLVCKLSSNRSIWNESFDDETLDDEPLFQEKKKKSKDCCKFFSDSFNFFRRFCCFGGCCQLFNIVLAQADDRFIEFSKFYKIVNPEITLEPSTEDGLIKGEGVQFFWDLRKSTSFWKEQNDNGFKAAKFMLALKKHLFDPVAKKYSCKIVGNGGDGPLFVRFQEKSETKESITQDAVQAGIELIVRYKDVKKEQKLEGPKCCGVGMATGPFWFYFSPLSKETPAIGMPAFVSKSITDAYRCDQSNKMLGSVMTVTREVYDHLEKSRLKNIFQKTNVQIKTSGFFTVYSTKLSKLKEFYAENCSTIAVT